MYEILEKFHFNIFYFITFKYFIKMKNGLKIVVLGATGETGIQVLKLALKNNHNVTAIVRNKASLIEYSTENLNIVEADVFDAKTLEPHFSGKDVIISALGFTKVGVDVKMTLFTDSMKSILTAMHNSKVSRIITISAWFTDPNNRVGHKVFDHYWSKIPGLTQTLNNEYEMEEMLKLEKDIYFTSVRCPFLTWDESKAAEIIYCEGNWVPNSSAYLGREDVARFLIAVAEDQTLYKGKCISIAGKFVSHDDETATHGRLTDKLLVEKK